MVTPNAGAERRIVCVKGVRLPVVPAKLGSASSLRVRR